MIRQFIHRNAASFYHFRDNIQEIDGQNSFVLPVPLSSRHTILRDSTLHETVSTAMTYLFAYRYTISHKWYLNNTLNYPRPTTHLLIYVFYSSVQIFPPPQLGYLYRNTKFITCYVQLNRISSRILHFCDPGRIKVLYTFVYQSAVMWPAHRKFSSVFSLQYHASHTLVSGWWSTTISMWCQYLWSHIPITKIILIQLLISTKFWKHENHIIIRHPREWKGIFHHSKHIIQKRTVFISLYLPGIYRI